MHIGIGYYVGYYGGETIVIICGVSRILRLLTCSISHTRKWDVSALSRGIEAESARTRHEKDI